jgi:hypothetical protein
MFSFHFFQNLEYLTLKELSSAVENLNICLKEENRVIRSFWTSQLPPKNHNGEYVDVRAMEEVSTAQSCDLFRAADPRFSPKSFLFCIQSWQDIITLDQQSSEVVPKSFYRIFHKMASDKWISNSRICGY